MSSQLEYKNGMLVQSDSFCGHSITFGDGTLVDGQFAGTNTWDDWHLIPATRPIVAEAGVSTNYVDIPGRFKGPIDLTEYLTGGPVFGARSGSFEFYLGDTTYDWLSVRQMIVDFLHGQRMKMVLEDDPTYYYEGRFSLNSWKSDSWNSKIVIDYALEPYRRYIGGDWLWDPFNFNTDRTDLVIPWRL